MRAYWFFMIKDTQIPIIVNLVIQRLVNKSIYLLISFIISFIVHLNNEQPIFRPFIAGSRGVFMAAVKRISSKNCFKNGW